MDKIFIIYDSYRKQFVSNIPPFEQWTPYIDGAFRIDDENEAVESMESLDGFAKNSGDFWVLQVVEHDDSDDIPF